MTTDVNDMLDVSALRERCATLEHELVSKKLAVPDAVAAVLPGGAENPSVSPDAWMKAFEKLVRMHAVSAAPSATSSPKAVDGIDDVLTAALADEPVAVQCSDGETRNVYPKSYHALRFLDYLDGQLNLRFSIARALAQTGETADEAKPHVLMALVESLAVRIWLWILTYEEPGLPFNDDADDPEPPAWTKTITPEDLPRFLAAHHEVHARRTALLAAAFPPEPSSTKGKLSLAGFLGAFSAERGVPSRDVMRRWTLGGLFASAISAAQSNKNAREAAKNASKH